MLSRFLGWIFLGRIAGSMLIAFFLSAFLFWLDHENRERELQEAFTRSILAWQQEQMNLYEAAEHALDDPNTESPDIELHPHHPHERGPPRFGMHGGMHGGMHSGMHGGPHEHGPHEHGPPDGPDGPDGPRHGRHPPPDFPEGPPLWIGLTYVFSVMLISAALVGIPLLRRIRILEEGISQLGSGRLDARIQNAGGLDALGKLSTRFNEMADRIQDLFLARESLLQSVSHELGTPLARMQMQLAMLKQEIRNQNHQNSLNKPTQKPEQQPEQQPEQHAEQQAEQQEQANPQANPQDSPKKQDRIFALEEEIRHLDDLSAELVRWVESDGAPLERSKIEPLPRVQILAEMTEMLLPEEIHISIENHLSSGDVISVDIRSFDRAVENILRNASRYAKQEIVVVLRKSGTGSDAAVEIGICDDGVGIPEEMREKVWEPFARLDKSRTRATGGIGLGLAMVKRICGRHGGRAWIETAPQGGAAIWTRWPAA